MKKQIIRISLLLILHLAYAVTTEILNAWHIYSKQLDPPEGYILTRNIACSLVSVTVFAVIIFYTVKTGSKNGFVRLYPTLIFALNCTDIILGYIPSHNKGAFCDVIGVIKSVIGFISVSPMSAMFIIFDDMMSARYATLLLYFVFWVVYSANTAKHNTHTFG